MNKTLLALAVSLVPSVVSADGLSNAQYAVITAVHPVYTDRYVDTYENVCYDVQVPVYGRVHGGSDADVLVGALIGGAIGNQFGGGSGKDAMTVLGAIVGANKGANASRDAVVGYRYEPQCESVRTTVNDPIVSHYRISYTYNGYEYSQETAHKYTLGQRVSVQPALK
jgi:uncharacterized protein YcfJ